MRRDLRVEAGAYLTHHRAVCGCKREVAHRGDKSARRGEGAGRGRGETGRGAAGSRGDGAFSKAAVLGEVELGEGEGEFFGGAPVGTGEVGGGGVYAQVMR